MLFTCAHLERCEYKWIGCGKVSLHDLFLQNCRRDIARAICCACMANSPAMDGLRLVYRQPAWGWAEGGWRGRVAPPPWLLLGFLLIKNIDPLQITREN